MTGNRVLLDTNIISALLKGEVGIADKIDKSKEVYIPAIAIGELYYGAAYSTQTKKNISDIQKLLERYSVLSVTEETATFYGNIKSELRKKGKPIPENDIWISAIALQNNLSIATRDKHFKQIENLAVKVW